MKKPTKKKRPRKKRQVRPSEKDAERLTWVDRIAFESVASTFPVREDEDDDHEDDESEGEGETTEGPLFSLISWNILAEAYCSRRSHRNLPAKYQKVVFSPKARKDRLVSVLESFADGCQVDCICLQEVDLDQVGQTLRAKGYEGVESPRTKGGGAGGRTDACAVYVRRRGWKIVQHKVLFLDNLATLSSKASVAESSKDNQTTLTDPQTGGLSTSSNLHGIQQAFLRRNMALLVRLQHLETGRTVLVANTHLYWNPGYEHVKLCQAHYILLQAREMLNPDEPLLFCGDLNSRPTGVTHTYLTSGHVNAKRMAPWYSQSHTEGPEDEPTSMRATSDDHLSSEGELVDRVANMTIADPIVEDESKPLKIRYLLDATLNKLCRWLRMLGQDAALETDEEERMRTKEGKMVLFDRCRDECRTLVTTSTRMILRRDCPSSTYCINPNFLPFLEVAMVHMFLTHGVILRPTEFLSRCVVCNGAILEVSGNDEKRRILKEYHAPTDLGDEMEVYECDGCKQGYWWNERPTSSASRVKNAATRLFELCVRAGVAVEGDLDMFDHVCVDEERQKGWDCSMKGSDLLQQQLDVIEWLRDERLECPFELTSAYAHEGEGSTGQPPSEILPFTNVTSDFINTLDYVFFEKSKLTLEERLYVPTSLRELNKAGVPNGHLLPSNVWPSDHLSVGACFSFADKQKPVVQEAPPMFCAPLGQSTLPPMVQVHDRRCDCGCVPAIPSLFEMAELRKQAKLAKQRNA